MQQLVEFVSNHWLLVSIFIAVTVALLLTVIKGGKGNIAPTAATTLINRDEAVVIDVRSAAEFSKGHIINAINIPINGFASQLNLLEKHKGKPIVVYCNAGSQSTSACSKLRKEGFDQVYNLSGGIMGWLNAGLPISKK